MLMTDESVMKQNVDFIISKLYEYFKIIFLLYYLFIPNYMFEQHKQAVLIERFQIIDLDRFLDR